jgi:hypothetical protein
LKQLAAGSVTRVRCKGEARRSERQPGSCKEMQTHPNKTKEKGP